MGAPPEEFTVIATRSGRSVDVGADQTIIDALSGAGVDPPWMCGAGFCGTCLVGITDGVADHRDILPMGRRTADQIAICVSRSHTPTLTLEV